LLFLTCFVFEWLIVRDDVSTLLPSVFVIVFDMVLFGPAPDFVITIVCEPAGFVFERIFVVCCFAIAGSAASEPEMSNAVRVLFMIILRVVSYLICERRAETTPLKSPAAAVLSPAEPVFSKTEPPAYAEAQDGTDAA
jgi:hypothetical protein